MEYCKKCGRKMDWYECKKCNITYYNDEVNVYVNKYLTAIFNELSIYDYQSYLEKIKELETSYQIQVIEQKDDLKMLSYQIEGADRLLDNIIASKNKIINREFIYIADSDVIIFKNCIFTKDIVISMHAENIKKVIFDNCIILGRINLLAIQSIELVIFLRCNIRKLILDRLKIKSLNIQFCKILYWDLDEIDIIKKSIMYNEIKYLLVKNTNLDLKEITDLNSVDIEANQIVLQTRDLSIIEQDIKQKICTDSLFSFYKLDMSDINAYGDNMKIDSIQQFFGFDENYNKISGEMKKMKIFIGSSTESYKELEQIARIFEELLHKPITWKDDSVFIAGDVTFDSLSEISKKVDAAVFVFKDDDKVWYRNAEYTTVRDNVLLEYGIFAGYLGRKKVIFICDGNPKLASDLNGITYLEYKGFHTLKEKLRVWIDNIK